MSNNRLSFYLIFLYTNVKSENDFSFFFPQIKIENLLQNTKGYTDRVGLGKVIYKEIWNTMNHF